MINNLDNSPRLKELLTNYCLVTYEENAIITDEYLLQEYHNLLNNNELSQLFETEVFSNYWRNYTVTT